MNFRAKVKFFLRLLLKNRLGERFLILVKENSFFKKITPPEQMYESGSYRVVIRDGVRYRLDISDLIDHSLYFHNHYFSPLRVFQLLKEDSVFIDIGANIGTVALRAASISKNGSIYAFEPDKAHYDALNYNSQLNQFKNINIINKALGEQLKRAKLFKVDQSNKGMNRILTDRGHSEFEWVDVTTLDDEVERLNITKIDLIKIDVEGYEFNVLRGAKNVLKRFHPILIVEVIDANLKANGQSSSDVINLLSELGYEMIDLRTNKPICTSQKIETDILCYISVDPLFMIYF